VCQGRVRVVGCVIILFPRSWHGNQGRQQNPAIRNSALGQQNGEIKNQPSSNLSGFGFEAQAKKNDINCHQFEFDLLSNASMDNSNDDN
jgi:hypothetical protein